jgi:hypothetical protein
MLEAVDKFARVFGACVITVSLCSGCATGTPTAQPIAQDLNRFQPDCKIVGQQRALLESMRPTQEEIAWNKLNPFTVKYGDINTQINFLLHQLSYCDKPYS